MASTVEVWETWFKSWWAGNWGPDDLPVLRYVIRLWDRVHKDDLKRSGELRQLMDSYGISLKGQQDRRWVRPVHRSSGFSARMDANRAAAGLGPYRPGPDRPSVKERMKAAEAAERRRIRDQFRDIEAAAEDRKPRYSRFDRIIGAPGSSRFRDLPGGSGPPPDEDDP